MRLNSSIAALIISLWILSGCSVRHDFVYQPEDVEALAQTPLRIAVLPFNDQREFVDDGIKDLAYIPLVPTASNTTDAPQSKHDRKRGVYYFPDLVAYGLALDLAATRAGSVAHFAPEVIEDYDIIIDGSILSMAKTDRSLTYGLSAAAFPLHMLGAPSDAKSIDFVATYRVRQPNGQLLYEATHEADWTTVRESVPFMEGINESIKEANVTFLEAFAPTFNSLNRQDLNARRRRYFYAALDSELKNFDAERIKLIKQGRTNTRKFKKITAQMNKREKWLEKYRTAERKIVNAQQEHIFEKQYLRLQKINEIRAQKRAIVAKQQAMEDAKNRQAMKNFAGALVAGVTPALQSANALGSWKTETTMTALQDVSSAFSAVPPDPTEPPPDMSKYLAELDVDFAGLESAAAHTHKKRGGIAYTRSKFLNWYRKRITPLRRIR